MLIGYARVSTYDQNLDLQIDALNKAGCERIFEDRASGVKSDRPGLKQALEFMREGDVLVVYKLDRIGAVIVRSGRDSESIKADGKGFRSLDHSFDTSIAGYADFPDVRCSCGI